MKRNKISVLLLLVLCVLLVLSDMRMAFAEVDRVHEVSMSNSEKIIQEIISYIEEGALGNTDECREEIRRKFSGKEEEEIRGNISCLDAYSYLYNPRETRLAKEFREENYTGIGVTEAFAKDDAVVVAVVDIRSPAADAGIRPGDVILGAREITEEVFTPVTNLAEAVREIRGPDGTTVMLQIRRDGVVRELPVQRVAIDVEYVTSARIGDVGYVQNIDFTPSSAFEFLNAVQLLNLPGETPFLIVDVRDNAGGNTNAVLKQLSFFSNNLTDRILTIRLKSSERIYSVGGTRRENIPRPRASKPANMGVFKHYTVVVLINGQSASSSEIFAGTMKDWGKQHGRFIVVGEPSYGKGVGQRVIPLSNGGSLYLTSFEFFVGNEETPVKGMGVVPHYVVKDTRRNERGDLDVSLTATKHDAQYMKALEILRGIEVCSTCTG